MKLRSPRPARSPVASLAAVCVWALAAHVAGCSGCSCSCAIPTLASTPSSSASGANAAGTNAAAANASSASSGSTAPTVATNAPSASTSGFAFGDGGIVLSADTSLMDDELPVVKGPLQPEAVRDVIHKSYLRLRGCEMQALSKNPEAEGQTAVDLQIGPDGTVQGIKPGAGVTANREIEDCVVDEIRGMKFPSANDASTVSYKLAFHLPPDNPPNMGVMQPPSLGDKPKPK